MAMKKASHSRVTRPESRAESKQLIQTLENRRLMSLTAGFDFAAPTPPPAGFGQMQITHDFEQAPPGFGGGFGQPLPGLPMIQMNQAPNQNAADASDSTAPNAVATATTTTTGDATKIAVSSTTTLSSLYSALGDSTVAQIDSANSKSLAATLDDSLQDNTRSTTAAQAVLTTATLSQNQPSAVKSVESTLVTGEMTNANFSHSDADMARALAVVAPPVTPSSVLATVSVHKQAAPSWTALRRLEDELVAVRAFANQAVSELVRESAIALAHVESLVASDAIGALSGSSLVTWRSVAATGAIIAGVAYAQNKTESEKQKPANVFSAKMIERVAM
jgi:hypothetical protein